MPKKTRKVIAQFNGMAGDVSSPNLPDSYSELSQNVRSDRKGVIMPRKGTCSTNQELFDDEIESIAQVDTNVGPCILLQHGNQIYANRVGTEFIAYSAFDYRYRFHRAIDDAPEQPVMAHEHLIPFFWSPVVYSGPTFTTGTEGGVAGYYVTVYFGNEAKERPGANTISPYIIGGDMVVDGDILHSWVYEQTSDNNAGFTSVFVPSTATNWQFRYSMLDGSDAPLSKAEAIPFP